MRQVRGFRDVMNSDRVFGIHRHGLSIDISSEFFQLRQNPSIGHQRLTAKSPTTSARHRWQIEAWGASRWSGRGPPEGAEPELAIAFRDSTHATVFARRKEEPNPAPPLPVPPFTHHLALHPQHPPKQPSPP